MSGSFSGRALAAAKQRRRDALEQETIGIMGGFAPHDPASRLRAIERAREENRLPPLTVEERARLGLVPTPGAPRVVAVEEQERVGGVIGLRSGWRAVRAAPGGP